MANKNLTNHELFWLASYTHNTLAPLLKELKAIEPSIQNSIRIGFADTDSIHYDYSFISVDCHWKRSSPIMFMQESHLTTKAEIDALAGQVRAKVDELILQQDALKIKESNPWTAALEPVSVSV